MSRSMLLGQIIAIYRKERKLSVRRLAATIGIDHTALYRFERGHSVTNRNLALIFCWVLGG